MHSLTVTCVMLMCVVSFVEVLSDDELRCYTCTGVIQEKNGKSQNGLESNWCESLSLGYDIETCPNSTGYMCSFVERSVSFGLPSSVLRNYKVTVQKRGCMKVKANPTINHCKPVDNDDEDERKFVGTVLTLLAEPAVNLTVDGKICVCGTDLCDATCNNGVFYFLTCHSLLSTIVFGIVEGICALILVTLCCCYWFTWCERHRPHFTSVRLPALTMATLPQASGDASGSQYSRMQEEPDVQ